VGKSELFLKCIWQGSNGPGSLKVRARKGSRIIVCHAGSDGTGFDYIYINLINL
jgi:hypothetical protein